MATTYNGITSDRSWENLHRSRRDQEGFINVGNVDRVVSGLAAAAVAVVALRRRRLRPLLLPIAGSLITRAITGRSSVSRAVGRNRARADRVSPVASVPRGEGIKVERNVLINRPVHEVYQFWRNFDNLPRFMQHVKSVRVIDDKKSHWVVDGPAGKDVEWDAEIIEEVPGERIAWRSIGNADVALIEMGPISDPATGAATRISSRATSATQDSTRSVVRRSGLRRQRQRPSIARIVPHPLPRP